MYQRAVAAGAESVREPEDQFYGDRIAGIEDPFGYNWYIATRIRDVTERGAGTAALGSVFLQV